MPDLVTVDTPAALVEVAAERPATLEVTDGSAVTIEVTEPAGLIEVSADSAPQLQVTEQAVHVIEVIERGLRGPAGAGGIEYDQPTPAATWIIGHPFDRYPTVACFDPDGIRIFPDEHASTTTVSLVFATPMAGTAVLT